MILEPPSTKLSRILAPDLTLDRHVIGNGIAAFLFSSTGPLAIVLSVATGAGLSKTDIASWILGGYGLTGAITIAICLLYRQPITIAWTIPGAVLVGPALGHFTLSQVISAYLATGIVVLLLGLTGLARKAMALIPVPIVMGMVAGVFWPYALRVVSGVAAGPDIGLPMVAVFLVASAFPRLSRTVPPVLAALVVGAAALFVTGDFKPTEVPRLILAYPVIHHPTLSFQALVELVLPLAITVIGIQNSQGFSVLAMAGYEAPINVLTVVCGAGTLLAGLLGSVPICVTGPANAIICEGGPKKDRYFAGILYGGFFLLIGAFAPAATQLGLAVPHAFIDVLGALALVGVLRSALLAAFRSELTFGALTAMLLTLSDATIFHVGSAFWGLVVGLAVSWVLERDSLLESWKQSGIIVIAHAPRRT